MYDIYLNNIDLISTIFQFIVGILIVIGVAVSWSGATQFSHRALNIDANDFYAPYFMVWFSTNFMILCYPAYIIFASIYQSNHSHKSIGI